MTKQSSRIKSSHTMRTKHVSVSATHFMIKRSIVSYAVLVFLLFATVSASIYLVDRIIVARANQASYDQITQVYSSLQLGDSYRIANSDIFGDKRTKEWDAVTTYPSTIEYGHNDTVSATFNDLKTKLTAAGFTFDTTRYGDGVARLDRYKNAEGERVSVSVVSSKYQDVITYGTSLDEWAAIADKNAGPSYVTIRVNLDDNGE